MRLLEKLSILHVVILLSVIQQYQEKTKRSSKNVIINTEIPIINKKEKHKASLTSEREEKKQEMQL